MASGARPAALLLLVLVGALALAGGARTAATPTPPTIGVFPENPTNSGTARFEFSGDETAATFRCGLDGADLAVCTSPMEYAALDEGPHTFAVRAVDSDGIESEPATFSWTIDVTPPPAPSLSGPPARTSSTSAAFTFGAGEADGTFVCRLDGAAPAACASPTSYAGLGEGFHTFEIKAVDAAGNESAPTSHAWTVDVTAPDVIVTSPTDGTVTNDSTPELRGSGGTAVGDAASVKVDVREGSATTGPPDLTLTASVDSTSGAWSATPAELSEGSYTVRAEQVDDVGNTGESAASSFTVDTSVPKVTLVQPVDGTITEQRSLAFAGTADPGTLVLELYEGWPAAGSPVRTADVPVAGGSWSFSFDDALPDELYTAVAHVTNAAGSTGSSEAAAFAIDNAAPWFTHVPSNKIFQQTSRAGEVFHYEVTAEDELDQDPNVACSPASGRTFPRGRTRVRCTVTDWAGHAAQSGFTVSVVNTIRPRPVAKLATRAGNGSVRLRWRKPTDWDYRRVVISRARRGSTKWRVVFRTTKATAFRDRRVTNDREYVYRARSYDLAGGASAPRLVAARPSALLAPAWRARLSAPPLLRWTPIRKATYYNVQVWRDGRKILSRWPTRARYRLTAAWTFGGRRHELTRGTYYVYAWPGFGSKALARYGRVVGWTRFSVR